MDFKTELQFKTDAVNAALEKYLAPRMPQIIYEAMGYSVFAGGKRLRPILLISACEALGGDMRAALPFACAMEMIHTYSLIHDDLPGMDNDDFRRGNPTCHKKFDEGIAILAGDGLLTLAFEIMLDEVCRAGDVRLARAAAVIAHKSGSDGMLAGQVVDVCSDGKRIDTDTLRYIHENKTGGLIKAVLTAGALIGGADDDTAALLEKAGACLGIAFQIKDDILDVTSTTQKLGKPVGSDEKNKKATYVSMFGLEKAQNDYEELSHKCDEIFSSLGGNASFLAEYVHSLAERDH